MILKDDNHKVLLYQFIIEFPKANIHSYHINGKQNSYTVQTINHVKKIKKKKKKKKDNKKLKKEKETVQDMRKKEMLRKIEMIKNREKFTKTINLDDQLSEEEGEIDETEEPEFEEITKEKEIEIFKIFNTNEVLFQVTNASKILKTDEECTNLYLKKTKEIIEIFFGIQNQKFRKKLSIEFHQNSPIFEFFPFYFGKKIFVIFKKFEVCLVTVKSVKTYHIKSYGDIASTYGFNTIKKGGEVLSCCLADRENIQYNIAGIDSDEEDLDLEESFMQVSQSLFSVCEGIKQTHDYGWYNTKMIGLYLFRLKFSDIEDQSITSSEVELVHYIDFLQQDRSLYYNMGNKKSKKKLKQYFDTDSSSFSFISMDYSFELGNDICVPYLVCVQKTSPFMIYIFEYVNQFDADDVDYTGLRLVRNPFQIHDSEVQRAVYFNKAFYFVTSKGELIRVAFDEKSYMRCFSDSEFVKKEKGGCFMI